MSCGGKTAPSFPFCRCQVTLPSARVQVMDAEPSEWRLRRMVRAGKSRFLDYARNDETCRFLDYARNDINSLQFLQSGNEGIERLAKLDVAVRSVLAHGLVSAAGGRVQILD